MAARKKGAQHPAPTTPQKPKAKAQPAPGKKATPKKGVEPTTPTAPAPAKKAATTKARAPAAKRPTVSAKSTPPKARKPQVSAKDTGKAKEAGHPAPAPVDEDADTSLEAELLGCTVREARFIDNYLVLFNAEQAYLAAGFNAKPGASAQAAASRLLSSVKLKPLLAKRTKAVLDRSEEERDRLIESFTLTAYGDVRELSEFHRGACRYCYGQMHRYQFTAGEWDRKMTEYVEKQEKAADAGKPMPKAPDAKGGTGYDWRRAPHPDCPECSGMGEGRNIIKDTRHYSPAAVALFAGVKETKDGIEVKIHDQMRARDTLAKIRKLYEDTAAVTLNVDPAELEKAFGEAMRKSHERMEEMRRDRGLDGAPAAGA